MPNDTAQARNAALAGLAESTFGTAFDAGIRHAARRVATALSDYPLPGMADRGLCFACGEGDVSASRAGRATYLSDLCRNQYGGEAVMESLNAIMARFESAQTWREYFPVTLHVRQYDRRTVGSELHIAVCGPCRDQLVAILNRENVIERGFSLTECAHCHIADVAVEPVGRYIGSDWLRRHINTGSSYTAYREVDLDTAWSTFGATVPNAQSISTLELAIEPLAELVTVPGTLHATRGNYVTLCADCETEHSVCWQCGSVHDRGEATHSCRRCGISEICGACYVSHEDHFSPRDFATPVSISGQIARNARLGRPGAIIRSTRTVGQEVETGARRGSADARPLRDADVAVREATGFGIIANIGTDCSIDNLNDPHEIRGLPVSGQLAEVYVQAMADALQAGNWSHNMTTGAHVHVAVDNATFWRAYVGHAVTQTVPMALSDARRFDGGSTYARPIRERDIESIVSQSLELDGQSYRDCAYAVRHGAFGERYHTVNATSFDAHGTIEIRTASGDVPHDETRNMHLMAWISGATDYFVTDEGFALAIDQYRNTGAIVNAVFEHGHIAESTRDYLLTALGEGIDLSDVDLADEDGSYICSYCECECEDCECESGSGCEACTCNLCEHDNGAYANGRYYYCNDCDSVTGRVGV